MLSKRTISKEVGVFLIVSLMVFSSLVGTAALPWEHTAKNGSNIQSMTSDDPVRLEESGSREILFSEGFEGTFPPTGWTRIITNPGYCDDYPQYSAHWDQFSDSVHNGTKAAYVWWDYQHQEEWLITPDINLVGISNGVLTFWSYGYEGSTYNEHYYLKISIDHGSTWTELFDLSSFPPNQGWNAYADPYSIDLSTYQGQTITLAWQVESPQNDGMWYQWCIDDILVTGGDNAPPVTTCTVSGLYQATITLTATDDMSGVDYTKYKLDNGLWNDYTTPIIESEIGDHTISYYSVDNVGNIEEQKTTTFTVLSPITITIKGGLGVSATIKNEGAIDITNLSWSIKLDGKLIFKGKTAYGRVDVLAAGEEITVKDSVFGFGKTNIEVIAGTNSATATGKIFLIFVLGVK